MPTSPAGCSPTTDTFANDTRFAIPDVDTASSQIVVSGVDPYLWDLDVTTFITHTFSADLDITVQSPSGTVVTLSTDNGSNNDDVFNGTVWDDDANDPVTDHAYANLTLASPLVAEEALGAFIGEDPNGTWTLSVIDDLAGDTGNINSWALNVATLAAAPTITSSTSANNTPVFIADVATASSQIVVSGAANSLTDMDVTTFITHTFSGDLDITVQSPSGTVVTLSTDNGSGNDDVFNGTVWDDDANDPVTDHAYANLTLASPLVAEEALGAFIGEDPNGTWTLTVVDDLADDTGNINSWTVDLDTGTCAAPIGPPPPPPLPPEICRNQPVTVDLARGQAPTNGPDVIRGTTGADIINALGGDDIICSLSGDDIVSGNQGDDRVFGGGGDDEMRGNSGDDILRGRAGDDLLYGQAGNDTLGGGADTDTCRGGTGVDTATACETTVGVP